MGIFTQLFGNKKKQESDYLLFGRFSDAYKSQDQYDAWDQSITMFENQLYLDAYIKFFEYLKDESQDNIKVWSDGNELEFELFQGSKQLKGIANEHIFRAVCKIATTTDVNIGFLRRLIEQNYKLKYGRYCLDQDNDIAIIFDSFSLDASPYKLYYALKEITMAADKQDDLLIDEFDELTAVNIAHTTTISDDEKDVKYQYLQSVLTAIFHEIEHGPLDANKYPGGINYLYLDAAYKIDYLVRPEGYLMEVLERINRRYFAKDQKNPAQKNVILKKEFQIIQQRPKEDVKTELYHSYFTFGVTTPSDHSALQTFISGELKNMDWYIDNSYSRIAQAIGGYIVGFSLFNYSVPKPDRAFLHLYYRIFEEQFFKKLGYDTKYINEKTNEPQKNEIVRAIQNLRDQFRKEYPNLRCSTRALDFSRKDKLAKTFLQMIAQFDTAKK